MTRRNEQPTPTTDHGHAVPSAVGASDALLRALVLIALSALVLLIPEAGMR